MHTTNSILIRAPRERIFDTVADLQRWPERLPHYRSIQFLENSPGGSVVKMAATRSGIPISWVSRLEIDRDAWEIRFFHLHAFTKGMRVVWTFVESKSGVLVSIRHDLNFRISALAPLADLIIGRFFIEHVANKTLSTFKTFLESAASVEP